MEVILLEKMRNLGGLGDQVKVRPGFARNYLIPYGKAVPATAENKAKFEARRAELERAQADALEKARTRAEKLNGYTLQIVRKVAEDGTMYGSVTNRDIGEGLEQAGFEVERSEIELPQGPLKTIGDHEVMLALHPEIETKIIVSVIGES
ncbi:50S ribosomal protein L9 [Sulfurifustis variabilis]|uniref:Large ribosomal subunit protein bL9 n=1 Tax=Sulfurifustis variabilis TaxID=1675686 RepID=A0A1B4V4N0_9GAMM|nr:50S ribosomal protein L9 [Sulfurifustis variabilis]BAU48470.1 50S ribosomal protein L9 [Sulfurifustis variabilis]